jgi:hypothetical protein
MAKMYVPLRERRNNPALKRLHETGSFLVQNKQPKLIAACRKLVAQGLADLQPHAPVSREFQGSSGWFVVSLKKEN